MATSFGCFQTPDSSPRNQLANQRRSPWQADPNTWRFGGDQPTAATGSPGLAERPCDLSCVSAPGMQARLPFSVSYVRFFAATAWRPGERRVSFVGCRLDGRRGSHHGWCLRPVGEGRGVEGAFACGISGGSVEAGPQFGGAQKFLSKGEMALPPSFLAPTPWPHSPTSSSSSKDSVIHVKQSGAAWERG